MQHVGPKQDGRLLGSSSKSEHDREILQDKIKNAAEDVKRRSRSADDSGEV
jgi:hypothetical protein